MVFDVRFRAMADALRSFGPPVRTVTGLTSQELAEIETVCLNGAALPEAYRQFMSAMGRSAGPLLVGTDIFYPAIVRLHGELLEFVMEDSSAAYPPAEAFIFGSHQGYQVYWMSLDSSDDPAVAEYQESDGVVRRWDTFTDFIDQEYFAVINRAEMRGG